MRVESRWFPVLVDERRARALRALRELAEQFDGALTEGDSAWKRAEAALFFHYLWLEWNDGYFSRRSRESAEFVVEAASKERLAPRLVEGFFGLGWVLSHIGWSDGEDVLVDLDEWVFESVGLQERTGAFDLISGLSGAGVYALERWPHGRSRALLGRVIDALWMTRIDLVDGIAWYTPQAQLNPEVAAQHPAGHFDLGVAHGTPGVVFVLAAAATRLLGQEKERAQHLLSGAVTWLASQRLSTGPSVFPKWLAKGEVPTPARAAWCYGDPGVAAALYASPAFSARTLAEEVVGRVVLRENPEAGVVDGTFCHGAAGLAHLVNRLSHWSSAEGLERARERWFGCLLGLWRPGTAFGGYAHHGRDSAGALRLNLETGLVTGIAGVALVLLAACSYNEPRWDRLFIPAYGAELGGCV